MEINRLRWRAIVVARHFKELFWYVAPRRRIWRWLFLDDNGELRRCGEAALADLRQFGFLGERDVFDPDPIVMARRVGRREMAMRIINYLNLDEGQVKQLMEADDGL